MLNNYHGEIRTIMLVIDSVNNRGSMPCLQYIDLYLATVYLP